MRTWVLMMVVLVVAMSAVGAGIRPGMSRAEVEAELGRPSAAMQRGDRLVLLYPNDGRVVLMGDRVVEASRVALDAGAEIAPAPPAAEGTKTPAGATGSPEAPGPEEERAFAAEAEKALQQGQRQREDATERLANGDPLVAPGELTGHQGSPASFWGTLAVSTVFQFLVTVVVLKGAFRWADVHADWGQMWLPALANAATQAGVESAAYVFWQMEELFHVDQALGYFALLFVLLKTTHACTLPRAVAVAGVAKIGSVVVWALLSVFLLRLFFA